MIKVGLYPLPQRIEANWFFNRANVYSPPPPEMVTPPAARAI
jgi:hypothetical protein